MAIRKAHVNADSLTNSELSILIYEKIHSERDREIMKDRLINGLTYERLAEKHELSVRQVKNIVYKALDRLF